MALGEFALIRQYFTGIHASQGIITSVGDDAAVLQPTPGMQLVSAIDTLVAGVHFPAEANAAAIAKRSLRVNLSDLAAMGATPKWFTLALTLPESSEAWLKEFAKGLAEDAELFGCSLVGGDTTRGPLTISIAMMGEVETGKAILRSGARVGDKVFVTGSIGSAAAALAYLTTPTSQLSAWQQALVNAYYFPEPQIKQGQQLLEIASSAIDISDGLIADLAHIADQSGVAMQLDFAAIPKASALTENFTEAHLQQLVLGGGDDYQLCFTVPESQLKSLQRLNQSTDFSAACIGVVLKGSGVQCLDAQGKSIKVLSTGYQHF